VVAIEQKDKEIIQIKIAKYVCCRRTITFDIIKYYRKQFDSKDGGI
jgi:hypothetical protein